jgi:hypothetical protein
MRCFHFGLIALLPVAGMGMALLAVRLFGRVAEDMGESWRKPSVWPYWLLAAIVLAPAFSRHGVTGGTLLVMVVIAVQTLWLHGRIQFEPAEFWNPALRQLRAGLLLGYAGGFISLAVLVASLVTWWEMGANP